MDYRDWIIHDIAYDAIDRITKRTVQELKNLKDGNLLLGDDSPLKNIWEEICVQVQFQYSIYWYVYEEATIGIIEQIVSKEMKFVKQALWLQTEPGCDWEEEMEQYEEDTKDWRLENRENYGEYLEYKRTNKTPYDCYDIAKYIFRESILNEAVNYRNRRIEKYLESTYDYN